MGTKSIASLVYSLSDNPELNIDDLVEVKKRKNKNRKTKPENDEKYINDSMVLLSEILAGIHKSILENTKKPDKKNA